MDSPVMAPARQVRAQLDAESIVVYQAYGDAIADAAPAAGTFVPPFSMDRMSWIKPSFLWMMYRCGWATKPGQERVLAIRMSRAGFEDALSESCLSHFDPTGHADEASWRREHSKRARSASNGTRSAPWTGSQCPSGHSKYDCPGQPFATTSLTGSRTSRRSQARSSVVARDRNRFLTSGPTHCQPPSLSASLRPARPRTPQDSR